MKLIKLMLNFLHLIPPSTKGKLLPNLYMIRPLKKTTSNYINKFYIDMCILNLYYIYIYMMYLHPTNPTFPKSWTDSPQKKWSTPHLNPLLLAPKITVSIALRCGRTKGAKGTGKAWLVPLALANCNQFSEPPQKVQVLLGDHWW